MQPQQRATSPPPPPPPYPPSPPPPLPSLSKPPIPPCRPRCSCCRHSSLSRTRKTFSVCSGYHFAEGTVSLSPTAPSPPCFHTSFVLAASRNADHHKFLHILHKGPRPPIHPGALEAILEAANKRKVGVIVDVTEQQHPDPRTSDLLRSISDYDGAFDAIMERTRAAADSAYKKIPPTGLQRPPPPPGAADKSNICRYNAPSLTVSAVKLEGNRVCRLSRNAEHHSAVVSVPGMEQQREDLVGDRPPPAAMILEAVVGSLDSKAETVYEEVDAEKVEEINKDVKRYVGKLKKMLKKTRQAKEELLRRG